MEKRKQKKNSWVFIIFQIIFLLFILIFVIFAYKDGMLTSNNVMIILVLLAAMSYPVIHEILIRTKKQVIDEEIVEPMTSVYAESDDDGLSNSESSNQTTVINTPLNQSKKTDGSKSLAKIIPVFVLIFCVWYVLFDGAIPFLNTNPVGRWNDIVAADECGVGIECVTEYWYIDLFDDGTLDIGWKNTGYVEESQGYGTWTQAGDSITMTIHYYYGADNTQTFIIKGSKLYDEAGVYSGFEKD